MAVGVQISKHLVIINSASSVAARVLNVSVLVWLNQYLLRRISPEEYSLLPVVMAVMVFVPLLSTVLTAGIGRYVVEAYAAGDDRRVTQIVSTMFPFLLATALVILIGGGTLAWYVDYVLTIAPGRLWNARIMLGLLMFSAAVRLALVPFGLALYVRQKLLLSNALSLCSEALRIILLFVFLLGIGAQIVWVVVASVIASLSLIAVTTVISMRMMPMLRFRWREIRWGTATELMAFGGWQLAGNVAEMIRTAADPLILNKFATAVDVSCFYLGSLALTNIQQASYLVHRSLGPPLIAMYATGRKDQLRNTYVRGGRYALWLSLLVCVPLMIYGREIIVLWVGDQYAKAATVMTLLLVMFVALYGHAMLGTTAMATGQVRPVMARALGLQIFNLILTLYLVKTRGMGAIGSATATFVTLVLVWPFFNWRLGLRMAELTWQRWLSETFWPGILPGVAAAAVCIALKFAAHPSSWLAVGVCTAGGLATYVIILLVFCLQHQDREELRRIKAILQDWRHRPES